MTDFTLKPIGFVQNTAEKEVLRVSKNDLKLNGKVARNQGPDLMKSKIIINDEYIECLDGIEDFSHINVLFWTHKISDKARQIKKVHPAGIKKFPLKGIFATRSPARPNPICITTVKLLEKKGNTLSVERLDAINGTPVIDIKPHLPYYDSPIDVKLAEWMYDLMGELRDLTKNRHSDVISNPYSTDIRAHPCIHKDQKTDKLDAER